MRGRPRNASIVDVARLASVSRMTVSRVLNAPDSVAESTRVRVEAAIKTLRYTRNANARDLVTQSAGFVGLIATSIANPFYIRTVRGLVERLNPEGIQVVVGDANFSTEQEERLISAMAERRPAGLVLMGVNHTAAAQSVLRDLAVPVIETWDITDSPIGCCIGFDNHQAGRDAALHLTRGGCRNLRAIVGSSLRDQKRLKGFESAVIGRPDLGYGSVILDTTSGQETPAAAARRATAAAIEADPGIDALFFSSDTLAIGALVELQSRGIAVPDRIAVMGFSDSDLSRVIEPNITTIRVPDADMGRKAADAILAWRESGDLPTGVHDLGYELVRRGSTRAETTP